MIQPQNAIEQRLDILHDQWNEFAVISEARVLRWLVTDDEWRTVEAFLAVESDDQGGDTPDLFVSFVEPFTDVDSYGAALLASLLLQYGDTRLELEGEEERDALTWQAPLPTDGVHSLHQFVTACASLRGHHADVMERLAIVLVPSHISDGAAWQHWLRAAAIALPEEVRLVVADDVAAPELAALAESEPVRVHSMVAGLDMPAAWAEIARAGDTTTPGGRFRVHFSELVRAVGSGDLPTAVRWSEGALAVSAAQGWAYLSAAVHATIASGLVSASRTEDALLEYQRMDAAGEETTATDPALGTKLRVQAAFGSGSALVAAGGFGQAAAVYEGAAPLATEGDDPLALMECWRMASYCHEQSGNATRAWECGIAALDAGAAIPPADRGMSTLSYVGEGLLRLGGGSEAHTALVEQRMVELTGTSDWRTSGTAVSQSPAPMPS